MAIGSRNTVDSGKRADRRGRWQSLVLAFVVALLAGCTSGLKPGPNEPYSPPAWMAEAAARNEHYNVLYQTCMNEAGYDVEVSIDGGAFSEVPPDATDAERDALDAASSICYDQSVEELGDVPRADDGVQYQRLRDTTECLHRNGHAEIGEPPSKSAWIDSYHSAKGAVWSPYEKLYQLNKDITEEEWYRLKAICVEGPVNYVRDFQPPPTE